MSSSNRNKRIKEGNVSSSDVVAVDNALKVFVSRIPVHFTEDSVKHLVETELGCAPGSVVEVGLKYADTELDEDSQDRRKKKPAVASVVESTTQQHKGFAFLQFKSTDLVAAAIALGSVKGGATPTSTKKHRLYLSAVQDHDDYDKSNKEKKMVCFLWQNRRCPYGNTCKFAHQGEGACLEKKKDISEKRKRACWDFQKGKCQLGDACPFLHTEKTKKETCEIAHTDRPQHEKDCINWKTKGKCRKGDKCPYRHDKGLQEKALEKLATKEKQTLQPGGEKVPGNEGESSESGKHRQPLSVRVFGLNYETTPAQVHEFFAGCGKIVNLTFPSFPDSGRSKGFCEILFSSPKAVAAAVQLNKTELHGRWLSVQAGKMYLKQWEEYDTVRRSKSKHDTLESEPVGEFGQKVKQRKKPRHAE